MYRFQISVVWNPCYSDQCVSPYCKKIDISPVQFFFVVNEWTLIGTMKLYFGYTINFLIEVIFEIYLDFLVIIYPLSILTSVGWAWTLISDVKFPVQNVILRLFECGPAHRALAKNGLISLNLGACLRAFFHSDLTKWNI